MPICCDMPLMEPAMLRELTPGRCVCVFPVRPRVQNRYGTLHGGCVATLVDVVSTVALLTVSKDPGVRYVHF